MINSFKIDHLKKEATYDKILFHIFELFLGETSLPLRSYYESRSAEDVLPFLDNEAKVMKK